MGRPREHDERTGIALLDAAESALAAGGPDAVSVRGVADAVGTTTRAVYSVFGSKDGLVESLATRGYEVLTELVAGLPETEDAGADLVAAGTVAFRQFARSRPHLFRLAFERVPPAITTVPTVGRAGVAAYRSLLRWIVRAQEAGVVDGRPSMEVAFQFHSMCQGLANGELSQEPPPVGSNFWGNATDMDMDLVWERGLRSLVAGMAPR